MMRYYAYHSAAPFPKRVFIMQFIDIHSHILPYLDDGAFSSEDSLEMARIADESGISVMICTSHASSHCRYSAKDLTVTLEHVADRLKKNGCAVTLVPGQEILIRDDADEILGDLENERFLTLAGSRYVLIEFRPGERSSEIIRSAELFAHSRFVPVIAHPERYAALAADPGLAGELHAAGALLQVNKGSLSGYFGKDARDTVIRLLESRQADFLASDAHSPFGRTPDLAAAHEWVSENCSPDYADRLVFRNPAHVLNDEPIRPASAGEHHGHHSYHGF